MNIETPYHYTVEMFDVKENKWKKHHRYYHRQKDLTEFDLYDVPNKRRNAKLFELSEEAKIALAHSRNTIIYLLNKNGKI